MNYIFFAKTFQHTRIFSILDIEKNYPNFGRENLLNWQKKGFLIRVRNGWYSLAGTVQTETDAFFVANKIYAPSYVSLESALAFYHWIPEAVFNFSSVSTLKTQVFDTKIGNFRFSNIKPSLFFGYKVLEINGCRVKIADPEKTLLDFLYFHPNVKTVTDFESFRFNFEQMRADLDWKVVADYETLFNSAALSKRLSNFKKTMADAEIN